MEPRYGYAADFVVAPGADLVWLKMAEEAFHVRESLGWRQAQPCLLETLIGEPWTGSVDKRNLQTCTRKEGNQICTGQLEITDDYRHHGIPEGIIPATTHSGWGGERTWSGVPTVGEIANVTRDGAGQRMGSTVSTMRESRIDTVGSDIGEAVVTVPRNGDRGAI